MKNKITTGIIASTAPAISLAEDISGFIGASVVDLGTGMSLASVARVANFDLDVAAAYNCEMVKAKRKTIQALGIDSHLQDMLFA